MVYLFFFFENLVYLYVKAPLTRKKIIMGNIFWSGNRPVVEIALLLFIYSIFICMVKQSIHVIIQKKKKSNQFINRENIIVQIINIP